MQINNLKRTPWGQKINGFIHGDGFIVLMTAIAFATYLFALDIYVYWLYAVIAVAVALFGDDSEPLLPIIFCAFYAISVQKGQNDNDLTYYGTPFAIVTYAVCFAVFVFATVVCAIKNETKRKFPKNLILGFALVLASMLCNGLNVYLPSLAEKGFGVEYNVGSTLLGTSFALCWFGPFFVWYYTLSQKSSFGYLAKSVVAVGVLISAQLVVRALLQYRSGNLFLEGTHSINVASMTLGWGMPNTVGPRLVIALPFAFYLALKSDKPWRWYCVALLFVGANLLTLCRNSLLFSVIVFAVGTLVLLFKSQRKKQVGVCVTLTALLGVGVLIVLHDKIFQLFNRVISAGFSDNGRFENWKVGMELFLHNPVFGGGFCQEVPHKWGGNNASLMANHYHNVVVQTFASTGIFGVVAMILHLVEVAKMLFAKMTTEKKFILFAILTVWALSLLDLVWHFQVVGFLYSVLLCYAVLDDKTDTAKLPATENPTKRNGKYQVTNAVLQPDTLK